MSKEELTQEIIESLARCQRPGLNLAWKEIGLSHAQLSMLFMLFYHPEASAKDIVGFLGISKSAISQVIDPLADKQLVSRQDDPKDRRIVRLNLTASGKAKVNKLNKLKFAGLRSALENLSTAELEQLYTLCQKMGAKV
jgi:DNA-binding MarR family transcriptional regulator